MLRKTQPTEVPELLEQTKTKHLEYVKSLSWVGISGVESERILLGISDKSELDISFLMFDVDMGV